jgi:hypothetical protein
MPFRLHKGLMGSNDRQAVWGNYINYCLARNLRQNERLISLLHSVNTDKNA